MSACKSQVYSLRNCEVGARVNLGFHRTTLIMTNSCNSIWIIHHIFHFKVRVSRIAQPDFRVNFALGRPESNQSTHSVSKKRNRLTLLSATGALGDFMMPHMNV